MSQSPDQPTRPSAKIITAEGWRPPWSNRDTTITLLGTFRTASGKHLSIGRMITITPKAMSDKDFDAAEYARRLLSKQLVNDVRRETGQFIPVGGPVRYQLLDDRAGTPSYIDLDWTWEAP